MSSAVYYIIKLIDLIVVFSIGIAIIAILLHAISNRFNLKHISIYGFFTRMDNIDLIMLSSTILKEIMLIYCVLKVSSFSIIYLYIFFIFYFIYALFSFNVGTFLKEAIISGIEYLIIYFLSLLSQFLVEVKYSTEVVIYIWVLSAILISCSIYFFSKNVFYVVVSNKNIRRNLDVKQS